jgi:predicted Zn-dependent protease
VPEHRPPRAVAPRRPSALGALVLSLAGVAFGVIALGCDGGFDVGDGGGGGGGGAGEGPGGRAQTLGLSPNQELALGRKAYKEVLDENGNNVVLKGPAHNRVKTIADKIVKAVMSNEPLRREINIRLKDDQGESWKFDWDDPDNYAVIQSKQVNAFCLPGGEVVVYTGLLDFVGDNDAWLATVLSHEISHALAHHASERMARENLLRKADDWASGLGKVGDDDREKIRRTMGFGNKFQELAFNRQQESEADHIGIFLMAFAGYDPDEAVRFWEKMQEKSAERGEIPEILSDHPSDAHRVAAMKKWSVRARAALKAWQAGRIQPPPQRDDRGTQR